MPTDYPDLLKGLEPRDADEVLTLARRKTVRSGEELFRLGDDAHDLFVVARGRIRLTLPMQVRSQQEDVLVEERAVGQTVGWSALIPPYRFTLKAMAPLETEVMALSRESLWRHFVAHPEVGYIISLNVASVVGQRLQLFQAMWLREIERMLELRCA